MPSFSFIAFRAEFKASPRLRLGLWVILGILWGYGLLLLRDEFHQAADEHRALARKVARAQALAGQTEWDKRIEAARALQVELESRLWRAGTLGLAQAAVQDWLNQSVQQAGLTRPATSVDAQEEAAGEKNTAEARGKGPATADLWKVSAKLSFDFSPQKFYTLMGRLYGADKQVLVESLSIRGAPVPRAEIVLSAYFQKPLATPPTEAPPGPPARRSL
ncbi:MAG: hypothetical protein A3H27_10475 [Acidobacteria bacterium RIFCSPLOWO2_02_FULL_59_13]|nr:MAG: hypothetical protein A3H27_10475 [Acidobacteria bacterium RIFCSPLOWO2_02_FULL_59_13]